MAQGAANTAYQYSGYIDPKTPSCGPCKEKNYTRTYCRTTKKHKTLPWSTVYIVLTLRPDGAIPPADEEVNPEIVKEMNAKRRRTGSGRKAAAGAGASEGKGKGGDAAKSGSEESKEDKAEGGKEDSGKPSDNDDGKKKEDGEPSEREIQVAKLNEISPSRTFLATVSVEKSVVEVSTLFLLSPLSPRQTNYMLDGVNFLRALLTCVYAAHYYSKPNTWLKYAFSD